MITTAGLCRCQRQAWRYEISQLMGRDREAASDLALGARKVRRSCDGSVEGVQRVVCV